MLGIARMPSLHVLWLAYIVAFGILFSAFFVESKLYATIALCFGHGAVFSAVKFFTDRHSRIRMKDQSRLQAVRPPDPSAASRLFYLKVFGWLVMVFCFPGGLIEERVLIFFFSSIGLVYVFGELCLQGMAVELLLNDEEDGQ